MEIGSRIKILRENARLTQIELAKVLKINNSTLSQYENGVRIPSDDIKISIANYFDVSLDYLLGRTNNKKMPTFVVKGGLNERHQQLIGLFDAASTDLQSAAIAVLRSSDGQVIDFNEPVKVIKNGQVIDPSEPVKVQVTRQMKGQVKRHGTGQFKKWSTVNSKKGPGFVRGRHK